jgi:aminodeoxyfutalosine synthase
MNHNALLESLHLADLIEPAERNEALTRSDLERLVRAKNPLAAAALADARRAKTSGVVATYPVTLRVRVPGLDAPSEDASKVSFALADVAGIEATEMQMLGALPADTPLPHAVELVRSLVAGRPDLPLRAFSADDVIALARRERAPFNSVAGELAKAGVATLAWRAGADGSPDAVRVHKAAHEAQLKTFAPVTYGRGEIGKPFLDRLDALREVAEATKGFVSAVLVPEKTEGASPLDGTAGTEDVLACALTRLALGHVVPHVTVDAHVLGHKLGAVLLSCGADDFVGAQAARAWAPPTDDGPRPLNPARVTKHLIEARRSPIRRDTLFGLFDGDPQPRE